MAENKSIQFETSLLLLLIQLEFYQLRYELLSEASDAKKVNVVTTTGLIISFINFTGFIPN